MLEIKICNALIWCTNGLRVLKPNTIRKMNCLRLSTSAPLTPFFRTSVVAKWYRLHLSTFLFHQIPFFGVGISNNCSVTTTVKGETNQTTRSAADTAHCATNAFHYFTCQKRRTWIVISPCWPFEILLSNLFKFFYIRGVLNYDRNICWRDNCLNFKFLLWW